MAWRTIFNNLTAGDQSANLLDEAYNDAGLLSVIPCTVTGSNALALTPTGYTPPITAYANFLLLSFSPTGNSTGPVTVNLSSLGALNLYMPGGTVQATSGTLVQNTLYIIGYNASLNSGAGGFVIINTSALTQTTVIRSYLAGLTLSNDSGTPNSVLDIAAGICADSTNVSMISLGAFTKSTAGAWASGSGSNGMGNGITVGNNTWYHVFAIINAAAADVYFDTSPIAANAPVGTTAFRRIGSFRTNASAHIIAFSQTGDYFEWATPTSDVNVSNQSTSVVPYTLTVPTGVVVIARIRGYISNSSSGVTIVIYSILETGTTSTDTPTGNLSVVSPAASTSAAFGLDVITNTSAQINAVGNTASTTLRIATYGWIDTRGRFN